MARSYDISLQSVKAVAPSEPPATAASRGGIVGTSASEANDAGTVGAIVTGGGQDGVTAVYDAVDRTVDFTNTDKGTVAVASHVAATDPHGDRAYTDDEIVEHSAAADPHGDRQYTDDELTAHTVAMDPHGDRAYASSQDAAHVAAVDPHGDRSYTDGELAGHVADSDPHGDRAYSDAELAGHVADADPHADRAFATSAIATHAAAADPHGDRAFATTAIATHSAASDPHGDRAFATAAIATHTGAADPHGDRAFATAADAAHVADSDPHTQYVKVASLSELVDDRVAALLVAGSNITLTYDDVANTLTVAAAGGGGGGTWGSITGTLSSQTDLQSALDAKLDDSQATAFGLSVLGAADAAAGRTALGLGTMAVESAADYALLSGATFSGAVSASSFSGAGTGLTGTAASLTAGQATKLATARNINGQPFDGTADITLTPSTLTAGSFITGGNYNGSTARTWAVDATSANTASKVVARDASGNFSASIITVGAQGFIMDAAAGTARRMLFRSGGSTRWQIGSNGTTEGGSDTGSDFVIQNFSDAGATLSTALQITRATGAATFSGVVTVPASGLIMDGAAGTGRRLKFQTSGVDRFSFGLDGAAESGSNAGSNFIFQRLDDSGAVLGSAIAINRASGNATFGGDLIATGGATLSGNLTGTTATFSSAVSMGTNSEVNGFTIGYRGVPRITSTTLTASSTSKCHAVSAGVTVPASTLAAGDVVHIYNNSASAITITQGAGLTMYWGNGSASTGNRTLGPRSRCEIWFNSSAACTIDGSGVT
jgi:hypothetical protein